MREIEERKKDKKNSLEEEVEEEIEEEKVDIVDLVLRFISKELNKVANYLFFVLDRLIVKGIKCEPEVKIYQEGKEVVLEARVKNIKIIDRRKVWKILYKYVW